MQNNKKLFFMAMVFGIFTIVAPCVYAADDADLLTDDLVESDVVDPSAAAVADYDVSGSLFQQITDLEQEKILMQLEKERAQLDLELDRLAAEKIKLHMEIDTLSGRAEQQQQEFEMEKAKLENETAKLELEKQNLMSGDVKPATAPVRTSASRAKSTAAEEDTDEFKIVDKYKLVNVIGAGNQLQATLADMDSGQNKRVSVGRTLDGFTVKSKSLDEGVVFEKDGKKQTLNIASTK